MKRILVVALAMLLLLTACSAGVSQAEYDALVAENEQLKQQLAQYEGAENIQTKEEAAEEGEEISSDAPNADEKPAGESDFIYVNNGSEVQINGYQGKGGRVVIPDEIEGNPVTRIGAFAFQDQENITELVLPEHLKYIGASAFSFLEELSGVLTIPESVVEIESGAFDYCSLTGLVIKGNCEIGVSAFTQNKLEYIYIVEGCSPIISQSAFSGNEFLTTAVIPASVPIIKEDAFYLCYDLVIYTPQGSAAEIHATESFVYVNTEDYNELAKYYAELHFIEDATSMIYEPGELAFVETKYGNYYFGVTEATILPKTDQRDAVYQVTWEFHNESFGSESQFLNITGADLTVADSNGYIAEPMSIGWDDDFFNSDAHLSIGQKCVSKHTYVINNPDCEYLDVTLTTRGIHYRIYLS